MTRAEEIKRRFEPRPRRRRVTGKSVAVAIVWATVAAVALFSVGALLSGCVSVGYLNREVREAEARTAACHQELDAERRMVDDLKAADQSAPPKRKRREPEVDIQWQ